MRSRAAWLGPSEKVRSMACAVDSARARSLSGSSSTFVCDGGVKRVGWAWGTWVAVVGGEEGGSDMSARSGERVMQWLLRDRVGFICLCTA